MVPSASPDPAIDAASYSSTPPTRIRTLNLGSVEMEQVADGTSNLPSCQTLVWMQPEEETSKQSIPLASPDSILLQKLGESSFYLCDQTANMDAQDDERSKKSADMMQTDLDNGADPNKVDLERQVSHVSQQYSKSRKYTLLAVFSCAQFLDIVSVSGALIALADIEKALDMPETIGTWVVNAYAVAFAGFLLLAGRISDMYNPKYVFITGFFWLGCFALGCGLSTGPIMLLVFRGLQGVGGALTIPSALNSIMHVFPEKAEQASALAVFSSSGALGSVLGLILAGVLLLINWQWCFFFIGVVALPLAAMCVFLIPTPPKREGPRGKMDVVGVGLLTGGLILLIFALTTGSTENLWGIPMVLAPLIISVTVMIPLFFWWETRIAPTDALIPPATWRLPNFALLFCVALSIYGWFQSVIVPYTILWQTQYGWSPLATSLRFLPLGITGGTLTIWAAIKPSHFNPRRLLGPSMFLCAIASTMLIFADGPDKYYKIVLPALVIGTIGGANAYICCNIAMMQSAPKEFAGVMGAIFNSALQVGTAVTVSIITTLSATVARSSPPGSYAPYRAQFYFIVALMVCEGIAVTFLYKEVKDENGNVKEVTMGH